MLLIKAYKLFKQIVLQNMYSNKFLNVIRKTFYKYKKLIKIMYYSFMKDETITYINETLGCTREYRKFLLAVTSHFVNEYLLRRFHSQVQ